MTIVHVHIEKTAGTTLKSLYMEAYGANEVWGYSASEDRFRSLGKKIFAIDSARQQQLRAQLFRNAPHLARFGQLALNALPSHRALTLEEVQDEASVIIGHFTLERMARVIDPAESTYRTVLRHPLERMWSHYNFLQQRSVPRARMRIEALNTEGKSFEEFAMQPVVQDYQSQAVGKCLEPYRLVGVVDHLDEFLIRAGLQSPDNTAPVINRGVNQSSYNASHSFVRVFEDFHQVDYALYNAALEAWRPSDE